MGRIDYFRRVQGAILRMVANSERRWYEEMYDAKADKLTLGKLLRDMNAMAEDVFSVWRHALDLGGSPVLPHIHFERRAANLYGNVQTEIGALHEPVPEEEWIYMPCPEYLGPDPLGANDGLIGLVAFAPPPANFPSTPGVDRESIMVYMLGKGAAAPTAGFYGSVVLRGTEPWQRGKGVAVATVSVHLT